jgi:hypothetical protein
MKPRPISITPVLNGFIVSVGCQNVVITNPDELGKEIAAYYKNPSVVEKIYVETKVNDLMDGPCNPVLTSQSEACDSPRERECAPPRGPAQSIIR